MAKKYVLNLRTKKIHLNDGCAKSKNMKAENIARYYTIEEAQEEADKKYSFKPDLCGNCFDKKKR